MELLSLETRILKREMTSMFAGRSADVFCSCSLASLDDVLCDAGLQNLMRQMQDGDLTAALCVRLV